MELGRLLLFRLVAQGSYHHFPIALMPRVATPIPGAETIHLR